MVNNCSSKSRKQSKLSRFFKPKTLQDEVKRLLVDPSSTALSCLVLLFLEIFLNIFIVTKVKYTEIDWSTYMQQVECFLRGELDYTKIYGDTGPIVYPAGHLYIYTFLYFLTDLGKNIRTAQFIFIAIYIVNLILVFRIYWRSKLVPPYALVLMCLSSYRIHSIYGLRLFNDPVAMCLFYGSVNLLIDQKWILASVFYSLAVSVKMNILLFAPGLLLIFCENLHLLDTALNISVCAFIQILFGFPFLMTHPYEYVKASFNLGRVFIYKWTVNWRFLSENLFISSPFHITLLVLHLITLLLFFGKRYRYSLLSSENPKVKGLKSSEKLLYDRKILFTLFTSNFIGICYARSLHYQFYVWYYHSLPYILWSTIYKPITKLCILGLIELCWNTYPSTPWSSLTLHLMHIFIIFGLWQYNQIYKSCKSKKIKTKSF